MRVALTSEGPTMEDRLDSRFGRAKYFILVDVDAKTGEFEAYDNVKNLEAAQGAGVQAAETVVRLGAEAVVTGHVGPKAFRVLSAAGVKVWLASGGRVADALEAYEAGQLAEASAADVKGHW